MAIIYHNGEFKDDSAPALSIHERALRLGEAVFNTMLVDDGVIYHAEQQVERTLKNSSLFLGQWSAPSAQSLVEAAQEMLVRNEYLTGRYALNTIITCGAAGNGLRLPETPQPQILMRALPCPSDFPPVRAIIAQSVRRNEGSPLSNIKCGNYGDNILAWREADAANANEAIMLNNARHVACATVSNIVVVLDGAFVTPPLSDGVMAGVTRGLFIERYEVAERSITLEELKAADGIYLMNSLRGVVPVVELDSVEISQPSLPIPQFFHLD